MPEPRCTLLLTADKRDPLSAAATEAFPDVEIAFCSPGLLWALECSAGCCTDAVSEGLVVPECTVLQN
jgi:hypothetical protein